MTRLSTIPCDHRDVDHFIRLVRRGAFPAASGGESRAYNLAVALVECLPGLDDSAFRGFCFFARLAYDQPTTAAEYIDQVPELRITVDEELERTVEALHAAGFKQIVVETQTGRTAE